MSDSMTSDEYLAHLRATGQAGEETPAEMDVEEYREWRVRQNGELAFISAPEMAVKPKKDKPAKGKKGPCPRCGKGRCECLELAMMRQMRDAGLPDAVREHEFWEGRKFRFDFAWVEPKIALEVEGSAFGGGRHNRREGFETDAEKYNEAIGILGWRVVRVTGKMVKDGRALAFMKRVFDGDGVGG